MSSRIELVWKEIISILREVVDLSAAVLIVYSGWFYSPMHEQIPI